MHRAAVDFHAVGQRAFMCAQTAIRRQQGGVNVQHPPTPGADKPRRQQSQKTGETDEVDTIGLQHDLHAALELLATGVNLVVDRRRR